MVEPDRIALVRHGEYDHGTGHLTDQGIRQADRAGKRLMEGYRFLSAVILTSPAPRAVETADRISLPIGVDGTVIITSPVVQEAGEHPECMPNLYRFASAVIQHHAPDILYDGRIVVVTHMPLVAAMMGVEEVGNGEVCFYEDDGRNPVYEQGFEEVLEELLGQPLT